MTRNNCKCNNSNKNRIRSIATVLLAVLLCALAVLPASAMQPLEPDLGTRSWSVFPADSSSSLQLEKLTLNYDITDLPEEDYENEREFLAAGSTLRAAYTFYNPTSVEQTVTMLLPAGDLPSYINYTQFDVDKSLSLQCAESYVIELDGQSVTPTVRGAWRPDSAAVLTFNGHTPREYADQLHDSHVEHALLSADTPVTVYTYQPDPKYFAKFSGGYMSASFTHSSENTWVFTDGRADVQEANGSVSIKKYVGNNQAVTLYVLGEDIGEVEWKLTDRDGRVLGGSLYISKKTITFGELAMQYYDPEKGITEQDWYNAVVGMMEYSRYQSSGVLGAQTEVNFNITSSLQYYLEYDVTLAPGARTVNEVTMPVYPEAMRYYSPVACTFSFEMPRTSDWASGSTFSLRVNTKCKPVSDEVYVRDTVELKKEGREYTYESKSLPSGTLTFTLCKWKNPVMTAGLGIYIVLFAIVGIPVLLIVTGLWLVTVVIRLLAVAIGLIKYVIIPKRKKATTPVENSENDRSTE